MGQKIKKNTKDVIYEHYHLQVEANSKKIAQKNDAIFSIYG